MFKTVKELFLTPVNNNRKRIIILLVAVGFIFMPQQLPNDWNLNTDGFWADIPNTYIQNPDFVYPPWGLILMLPYRIVHAEGARFFSVIVIGWFVIRQQWSLSRFFAILLSPYFLWLMYKSNMDVFVFLLPILLWREAAGTRWQNLGWGLALSILLLKPQGAIFVLLYLSWSSRKRVKDLFLPYAIVAFVTLPISLIGTPPLIIQWLNNITHPSAQNQIYWSINNVSLTTRYNLLGGLMILFSVSLLLFVLVRQNKILWTDNYTYASLLFLAMFSFPYASQQSIASAFACLPSWYGVALQMSVMFITSSLNIFTDHHAILALIFAFCSFILFDPQKHRVLEDPAHPKSLDILADKIQP